MRCSRCLVKQVFVGMQAIAALNKALAADPRNAEVLLSLGVSYTNELDQGRALGYLLAWLSQQRSFAEVRIDMTLLARQQVLLQSLLGWVGLLEEILGLIL